MSGFFDDGILGRSHVGEAHAGRIGRGIARREHGMPEWADVPADPALILPDVETIGEQLARIMVSGDGEALRRVFSTATIPNPLDGPAWAILDDLSLRRPKGIIEYVGYKAIDAPRLETSDRIVTIHGDRHGWRLTMPQPIQLDKPTGTVMCPPAGTTRWRPIVRAYMDFLHTAYSKDMSADVLRLWMPFAHAIGGMGGDHPSPEPPADAHVIGMNARAWREHGMWRIHVLCDGLDTEHVELFDDEARELARLIETEED